MTMRQYAAMMSVLTTLLLPVTVYPHGHPPTEKTQTIFEAYGMACNTALHEVYDHPAISRIRIIPGGIVLEIIFPESSDLPYAVGEAMSVWDHAGMGRWHGAITDARRYPGAGPTLHTQAVWLARYFRDKRQGVCDQRRRQR